MQATKSNREVRSFLALMLVVLMVLLAPQGVFAHASLVRAEPAPGSAMLESPPRVTLWFSEPIEPGFSEVRVLDSTGSRVDNGDSGMVRGDTKAMSVGLKPLGPGLYTVVWQNVSTIDGHVLRGSFVFTVGRAFAPVAGQAPTPRPAVPLSPPLSQSPLEPLLRWLSLLSILALVGGLSFYLVVAEPVLGSYKGWGDRLANRIRVVQWAAAGVLVGSEAVKLLIQTTLIQTTALDEISGSQSPGSPILQFMTGTDWGRLWLWRMALLVLVVVIMATRTLLPWQRIGRDTARWVSFGIAATILLTFSLTSHGAALTDMRVEGAVNDYLHLLAAAFWVGSLFHFALGMPIVQALRPKDRRAVLAALVPRFSTMAILSVGTLLITGFYSVWAMVGTSLSAFTRTPYGLSLLAKIILVAPLLVLGALNLMWVRPRFARGRAKGPTTEGLLRRLVFWEAVLAVLVLLTVGFLTGLEPARQVAAREGLGQQQSPSFHEAAGDKHLYLKIEPGQVGNNRFLISVSDLRGNPVSNADVSLRLAHTEAELEPIEVAAVPQGAGEYLVAEGQLGVAGPWRADLTVRSRGSFDARAAFRFNVGIGTTVGSAVVSPTTGRLFFGVELVLLGLLFQVVGRRLGNWRSRAGAAVISVGTAGAILGIVLMAIVVWGGW